MGEDDKERHRRADRTRDMRLTNRGHIVVGLLFLALMLAAMAIVGGIE